MIAGVSGQLADYIKSSRVTREYHKGEIIIHQGESFDNVYFLSQGFVKIYDIDERGEEHSISVFGPGSIFPVTFLLNDLPPNYFFFYEAMSPAACYVAGAEVVHSFLYGNPQISLELLDYVTRAYINLANRIQKLEKARVSERLDFILFHLAQSLGGEQTDIVRLDVPISQEELASLVGVTRESLSLEVNQRNDHRPYWKDNQYTYIDMRNLKADTMPGVL